MRVGARPEIDSIVQGPGISYKCMGIYYLGSEYTSV